MAWTTPRDWTAGETVTETMMDQQIKGNLEHIAGTAGFQATPSAARGIEPAAGFFAGSTQQNWHITYGSCTLSTGTTGTTNTFATQFASAPYVIVQVWSTGSGPSAASIVPQMIAVTTANFNVAIYTGGTCTGRYLAWGDST